jgi:cell division protein FtsN
VYPPPQAPPPPVAVSPPHEQSSDYDHPAGIRLIPPTNPQPGKAYKLQVGSYQYAQNAVAAFSRLRAAGLSPSYERAGDLYRVVLSGVRGADVRSVTEKLITAGFSEAIIREEN